MKELALFPLLLGGCLGLLAACSSDDSAAGDGNQAGNSTQGGGGATNQGGKAAGGANNGGTKPMGTAGKGEGGQGVSGQAGAGPVFIPPRGACAVDKNVGGFKVERQKDFGIVQGSLLDAPVPTSIPELVVEEGGCKLLKRRNLVCSPACVGAETCGEEGSCLPYPLQVDVGEVSISGLTKATTMTPQKPGAVYFAKGADNPPYEPGSQVILSAQGNASHEAFQLFGVGSTPLTEAPTWLLEKGKDLELAWSAPAEKVGTQVYVVLTIDQHGNTPLALSCELPDTGQGIIPKKLVDQMINSGVSGFPNGRIVRRTIDKVEIDVGCVELSVGSAVAATVRVNGFTPCMTQNDCPDGQTCNLEQEICE